MSKHCDFMTLKEIKCHKLHYNMPLGQLMDISAEKEGGVFASNGALCINTGKYTGRSPEDRFIVDEVSVHEHVDWSKVNLPISIEKFEKLYDRVLDYIKDKDLYVFDGYVGADKKYRMPIRVINEFAYQNMFAHHMFIKANNDELVNFMPKFTVVAVPDFKAVPELDGTNSEVFIIISFEKRTILIGGSKYCGEIKKSLFTVMNYLLPFKGVLPMHCSANMGQNGDVTLFFGLSGTGKTTLSADNDRRLIGDDEHGWSEDGVFNFEGGCYAKCIKLSKENEPQIWNAIREGTLLENVVLDEETKEPDYDDDKYTENTRATFPIEYIENAIPNGMGGIPKTIIFLTADATGVLPPISKLTKEQAVYHFMSGYTSKLAGTERGIVDPKATFSTCFGAPFMLLKPYVYAKLLGDKIDKYNVNVFLVNTGWASGSYGIGSRMKIKFTRAMVRAAMNGELDSVKYYNDPIFGLAIPNECPNVPKLVLNPPHTWYSIDEYYRMANRLADNFRSNFKQFKGVSEDILKAEPGNILEDYLV